MATLTTGLARRASSAVTQKHSHGPADLGDRQADTEGRYEKMLVCTVTCSRLTVTLTAKFSHAWSWMQVPLPYFSGKKGSKQNPPHPGPTRREVYGQSVESQRTVAAFC